MFRDLNVRLAEVKEKGRRYKKWKQHIEDLELERTECENEVAKWEERLNDEQQDVERLTGISLSHLIYRVMGKKEEKLEREQLEVIEAKVKYDEADRTVKDVKAQLQHAQAELSQVRGWRTEYEDIIQQKKQTMIHNNTDLIEMIDRQTDLQIALKELKEAIQAGDSVVASLRSALNGLQKAQNWGTYDMLGGGMISTHLKHSNIDEAMEYVHNAQMELRRFSKELRDVQMSVSVNIDIGEFLKFSDYFFDGFISDWMVQGRINNTLDQVEHKINNMNDILRQLNYKYETMKLELSTVNSQCITMIEQAE